VVKVHAAPGNAMASAKKHWICNPWNSDKINNPDGQDFYDISGKKYTKEYEKTNRTYPRKCDFRPGKPYDGVAYGWGHMDVADDFSFNISVSDTTMSMGVMQFFLV
jgi:hypothetical protein